MKAGEYPQGNQKMANQLSGMWDKALEEKACQMWNDGGLTASQIANALTAETGRTYTKNSIIGKMHRMQAAGRAESRKSPIKRAEPRPRADRRIPIPAPRRAIVCDDSLPLGSVTILQLRRHHCRFPLGDPRDDMRYCGAQAMDERPYCQKHHEICYRPLENKTPSRRLA